MEAKKPSRAEIRELQIKLSAKLPEILQLDPVVLITLRDKEYKLELDNKGVKDFYTDTGINLLSDFDVTELYKPKEFGSLLHRSLQRHQPELTVAEVDGLIEFRKFMYIRDKVMDSIQLFMPIMTEAVTKTDEQPDPH